MRRQTMCALGTGVQTCALPIYRGRGSEVGHLEPTQCLAGRFCRKAADKERARATGSERGKNAKIEAISPTWVCRIPEHIIWAEVEGEFGVYPEACERTHRSEEHTSELQSLMRISYAVFCLKKNIKHNTKHIT